VPFYEEFKNRKAKSKWFLRVLITGFWTKINKICKISIESSSGVGPNIYRNCPIEIVGSTR
jgi:hypothetical protein